MRHPAVEINHRVVVQMSTSIRIDMVNRVCLHEFAWPNGDRASWVISLHSGLSGTVEAVVATENTPDATQAHGNTQNCYYIAPDYFSAALESIPRFEDESDNLIRDSPRM